MDYGAHEHQLQFSDFTLEELSEKKVFIHCEKGLHTAVGGCLTWCNAQICDSPGSAAYICTHASSISEWTAIERKILNRITKTEGKKNAPKFIRFDALTEATQKAYEKMTDAETDEDRLARAKRIFTKNVVLLSYVMHENKYGTPTPEGIFPSVESSEVADQFLQWAKDEFKFPIGLEGFDSAAGASPQFAFRNWIARYVANFVFYGIDIRESFSRDKWEDRGDYCSDKKVRFCLDSLYCPEGLVCLGSSRSGDILFPEKLMEKAKLWVPHDVKSFGGAGNKKSEYEKTGTDPEAKERTVAEWKKIFSFKSEKGKVTITKYKGTDPIVRIPEKIGKSPVATIGVSAFSDQVFLTEIIIPDTITKIEGCAFLNCTSLVKVNIPKKVRIVDAHAFSGCISLKEVVVPNSVKEISRGLFENCTSLTKVVLPKNVTTIRHRAFKNCSSLTEIILPDKVEELWDGAFGNCSALVKIGIPKSTRYLGSDVFFGCNSLKLNKYQNGCYIGNEDNPYQILIRPASKTISEIDIHEDCEVLVEYVFAGCSSLKRFTIPERIQVIPTGAFQGCQSLEKIDLPDTIKEIYSRYKSSPFDNCSSLKEVVLPKGLTWINYALFYGCTALKRIVVPEGVTLIDSESFFGCASLTEVVIPSSVTEIDFAAFQNCSSLTEIVIPDSVKVIGSRAFKGCSSLRKIVIPESVTCFKDNNIFIECNKNLTIYGKAGSAANRYAIRNNIRFEEI